MSNTNRKRQTQKHFVAILFVMAYLFMIGCGQKYTNLEEYLQANPMPDAFTEIFMSGDNVSFTMDMEVSQNTIIMKMLSDKAIFSSDASINAKIKAAMDEYFNTDSAKASLDSGIDRFAEASGIDASLISVRYDMYNPGESIPSYSYTYTRQ